MKKTVFIAFTIVFTTITAFSQVPSYVPTNGLVGWWPFNGTANDESGNGNNGYVEGATLTNDRDGSANKAYDFNGVSNFIQFPPMIVLDNKIDLTFSVWIRPDANTGSRQFIMSRSADLYNGGFFICHESSQNSKVNSLRYSMNGYNTFNIYTNTGYTIPYNNWQHVTVVKNGNKIKFFIDGKLTDTSNYSNALAANSDSIYIGIHKYKNQPSGFFPYYFDGKIDDIGIWNRGLSDKEVLELYNGVATCNLISSATFTVPSITKIKAHGHVGYVNDNSNRFHSPLEQGVWNHVAITKDNSNNASIYKNGQLVFQGKFDNVSYRWSRIDLGAVFFTSYSGWFKGMIDELRVSNKTRSASEIASAYAASTQFSADASTVGLWHFDQSSGTSVTASIGGSGSLSNAVWDAQGRFGQCLSFNGFNARAVLNQAVPTTNMTIEFWVKPDEIKYNIPLSMYGMYTSSYGITRDTVTTKYQWSNGATGNSITVNPSQLPYIWVTDGNCYDTVFFKTKNTTYIKYDTVTISVKDTLIIAVKYSSVSNVLFNIIKLYPNPAYSHLNIDFNDYSKLSGYNIEIMNNAGKSVYNSTVTQKLVSIDLSTWTGKGLYFVNIRDSAGKLLETKKIVLQ
jgi:hypothetical protein